MACEVCEHCHVPLSRNDGVAIRDGYSYHKKCHKCYVCSETNLHNAEVFKGVIFCSSCSQRIFQGCFTARRTKTNKQKRSPTGINRRRERERTQDRKPDSNRKGVIESAGLGASTDSASRSASEDCNKISSKALALSTELALQVGKQVYEDHMKTFQKDSTEIGMTTDVTHELLKQINCPVITQYKYKPYVSPPRLRPRYRGDEPTLRNNIVCSDLRIAELGASTEMANMALRKKSEMPVFIKSECHLKQNESFTLSVLDQDSDLSGDNQEWMDSPHSTIHDITTTLTHHLYDPKLSNACIMDNIQWTGGDPSNTQTRENYEKIISDSRCRQMKMLLFSQWMDRRIGSLLKLPYIRFKKCILERSSLVSVLMSNDEKNFSPIKKLKLFFYDEITEHHDRGFQRLYSTINRKNIPHRLGWLQLVAKVSQVMRCKHFRKSHSYRCMRSHVMRQAGPTKSELAVFRNKVKRFVAPRFLGRMHTLKNTNQRAIFMTQACGTP